MIDLRSDTVTRPSPAMLAAMTAAEVGDDVWGDDPTVLRLQAGVAERAGKEAGLFFPSGTQSNRAALMTHCERGDEYLVGQLAHTYRCEGGVAAVLGISPSCIRRRERASLVGKRQARRGTTAHNRSQPATIWALDGADPRNALSELAQRCMFCLGGANARMAACPRTPWTLSRSYRCFRSTGHLG